MPRELGAVVALARATWLDAMRSRLLTVSLFFALVLVGLSIAAASVSFGERGRLIVDVGLAACSAMGSLIAVALSISAFAGELDRRTAYTILARPVPRWVFVLGKYLGVVAAMELVVAAMGLTTAATVWLYGDTVPTALWGCLWLTGVEIALVTAIAMLFSSLTVPALAAAYSAGLIIAGNLSEDMLAFATRLEEKGQSLAPVVRTLYGLIPDLGKLSLRTQAANDLPLAWSYLGWGTAYGLAYASVALTLTIWVFSRRKTI